MALDTLSPDSLAEILQYLDGIAVIRLLQCGRSHLSAKIGQIKKLRIEGRPFMKFPFFVFELPQLQSLSILRHSHGYLYPLRLYGAVPLPTTPVKSITKLSFAFSQSFSVLRLETDGVPLLDRIMPNLKSLHLERSTTVLELRHMQAVPKGLTKLHLIARYTKMSSTFMPFESAMNLPPGLKYLNLSSAISPDETTKDYTPIVWPIGLTSLDMRAEPGIIHHLPQNLTSLSLNMQHFRGIRVNSPIPTSIFPSSLTEINAFDMSSPKLKFFPTTFPPTLKRSVIDFDYSNTTPSDWVNVPKSITDASLHSDIHQIGSIKDLFPNVERVFGLYGPDAHPDSFLENLPSKLTELHLKGVSLSSIPFLPNGMKQLAIKIEPLAMSSQICADNSNSSMGSMSRLPHGLERLEIYKVDTDLKFCQADFDLIPRSLKVLSFELHNIEDANTLLGLPIGLKELSIDILSPSSLELISDVSLLDTLPSGITSLSLILEPVAAVWTNWMCRIDRLSALEVLAVLFDGYSSELLPVSLDFLKSLPRSITDLYLTLNRSEVTPEQMKGLPGLIRDFSLRSTDEAAGASVASDECFAALPKSLVTLYLPDDLQGLTSNIIHILPSNLCSISLPEGLKGAESSYYRQEALEWGDYNPM
jgi:hypothetical protein